MNYARYYDSVSVSGKSLGDMNVCDCDGCEQKTACLYLEISEDFETRLMFDLCADCLRKIADDLDKWKAEQERDNDK